MKLDYNIMQPGQEFWATRYTSVEKYKFLYKNPLSFYGIFVEDMDGKRKELLHFPNQGIGEPFSGQLEALRYRLKTIRDIAKDEAEKIQACIDKLEAENDLHQ